MNKQTKNLSLFIDDAETKVKAISKNNCRPRKAYSKCETTQFSLAPRMLA